MTTGLRTFVLNLTDLQFILAQVDFIPMFTADGDAVISWDGTTAVYDISGGLLYAPGGATEFFTGTGANGNVYDHQALSSSNVLDILGQSFPTVTNFSGLRNISGEYNNLNSGDPALYWGVADHPFIRLVPANFADYMTMVPEMVLDPLTMQYSVHRDASGDIVFTNDLANYAPYTTVYDAAPRMISQTITTGGVTLMTYDTGGVVFWDQASYDAGGVYKTMIDNWNTAATAWNNANPDDLRMVINPATQVEGAAVVIDLGEVGQIGNPDYQNPDSSEFFVGATNPGVAPVNGWFALFGQFFDHGLDFVDKSSAYGKIIIPLDPSDPLYGAIGSDGRPITSLSISRAVVDSLDPTTGDAVYINHTSPFIDQSQTYGSNDQVTDVLREWVIDPTTGQFHAGMNLLNGTTLVNSWTKPDGTVTHETLPTLAELNAHILATGRAGLTWDDVVNLRLRDDNGQLMDTDANTAGIQTGTSGHALLLDMNPHFDVERFSDATETALANTFIKMDMGPTGPFFSVVTKLPDGTYVTSDGSGGTMPVGEATVLADYHNIVPDANGVYALGDLMAIINFSDFSPMQTNTTDQSALAKMVLFDSVSDHYVAGDGRVNENFGLTSIHHVFHEEHNYQVDNLIAAIYKEDAHAVANGDMSHSLLHGYQVKTATMDAAGNYTANGQIAWDLDKVFNASKLIVEMEYQHTAVDQYARSVTPDIPEFVGYNSGVDSSISLEYGQAAFRFGHSTLRETIDTIDPEQGLTGRIMSYALELAFLNPKGYSEVGPGAVALGMTHQQMAEIDEIITPALNQGLLNQPMDLAAINIARGRDVGLPCLNEVREALGFARYDSWTAFGENMIHPDSLVNFIAAYSFNGDVATAQMVIDLASGIVIDPLLNPHHWTMIDAINFLNNTGTTIPGADGIDHVDTWIGGLAEAHISGGMLGEVFNVIFVDQIVRLEDGDRFYYLYRLVNQQFGDEIGNEQFKDLIERNTGISHLNGSAFAYADRYYDPTQNDTSTPGSDHSNHQYADVFAAATKALGVYTRAGAEDQNGTILHDLVLSEYQSESRKNISFDGLTMRMEHLTNGELSATAQDFLVDLRAAHNQFIDPVTGEIMQNLDGTPVDGADSNEVYVGTNFNDVIYMGAGDDTAYGEDGDDIIYGGYGIDRLYGGDGDDIIHGGDGGELIDGGDGDDIIYGDSSGTAAAGFNQVIGGAGNDVIYAGQGIDKISGGGGDDVIYGLGDTDPFTHGGDGNDYIDGGQSGDLLYGDNGDDVIVGGDDQDVLMGGNGDDILRPGNPSSSLAGFGPDEVLGGDGVVDYGFDLIDFSDYNKGAQPLVLDLNNQNNPLVAIDQTTPMPAMFQIEGAVGTQSGDNMTGDDGNNWLIGGSGDDTFVGGSGFDLIVGDKIRLDSLIGTYAGGDAAYNSYDTYTLANYRNMNGLQNNGLLDNASLGTQDFDKHFTEMLRTRMFKDYVLGIDETNTASGNDSVVYDYDLNNYRVSRINFTDAHGENITAFKIEGRGNASIEGTDLVVGVENFTFNGRTYHAGNSAPIIDYYYPGASTSNNNRVNLPTDPAANLNALSLSINENSTATIASIHAYDPDGQNSNNPFGGGNSQLSYALSGDDASLFQLTSSNGNYRLSFIGGQDYEIPADKNGDHFYDVNVVVSDGIATDVQAFQVEVKNVVEPNAAHLSVTGFDASTLSFQAAGTVIVDGTTTATAIAADQIVWNRSYGTDPSGSPATLSENTSYQLVARNGNSSPYGYGEYINIGGSSNQTLTGQTGTTGQNSNYRDIILGRGGNDTITGGQGDDRLDGGDGTGDVAVYSGSVGDFTITSDGSTITVLDNVYTSPGSSSNEGTDLLTNFEQIRFNGTTFGIQNANGASSTFNASGTNRIMFGSAIAENIIGSSGVDVIHAGAGADKITQTMTSTSSSSGYSGRDLVDGGADTDTYVLNNYANSSESFTIYTRNAALAAAQNSNSFRSALGTLAADTEIVLVRRVGNNGTIHVVAELDNIEEITTNLGNGDSVNFVGDFTETSMSPNTFHINGTDGKQTVDISQLNSNHRIWFKTNGGHDTIIGDIRSQDVIQTPDGIANAHEMQNHGVHIFGGSNGDVTMYDGIVGDGTDEDDLQYGTMDDDMLTGRTGEDDMNGLGGSDLMNGGDGADRMKGGLGNDTMNGGGGNDVMTGDEGGDLMRGSGGDDDMEAGDGRDVLFGGSGNDDMEGGRGADYMSGGRGDDQMKGGGGKDILTGGRGSDNIQGGWGDDTFVASGKDGDDRYNGGVGNDTLNYSGATANVIVELAPVQKGHGFVSSAQTGYDIIRNIENVITGSGNDKIGASDAVNILDGGLGDDIFIFRSVLEAEGDTIKGFGSGDVLDLTAIDANAIHHGNQAFVMETGGVFTAAGQIMVTYEMRGSEEYTVISGNVDADLNADFALSILGKVENMDQFLL